MRYLGSSTLSVGLSDIVLVCVTAWDTTVLAVLKQVLWYLLNILFYVNKIIRSVRLFTKSSLFSSH
jgi:hypothetical protein